MLADFSPILAQASIEGGLTMQSVTQYLFWVVTVAMGAGAVFFMAERNNVPAEYRSVLTVGSLICGIAAFHYFRMSGTFAAGEFPTEYRYIDWMITTPLLLVKFPLLLNLKEKAGAILTSLVLLDVGMILTAYIAEVSAVGGANWWIFFIIACIFEAAIVGVLYITMGRVIDEAPTPISRSAKRMRLFVLVGWAIYPIGFLMALTGDTGGALREIFYNVADVINKVGFGLVAYLGVKELMRANGMEAQPQAASG
jgi:bacteriorhodopsin